MGTAGQRHHLHTAHLRSECTLYFLDWIRGGAAIRATDKAQYERAWAAFSAGDLPGAWQLCRDLLRSAPGEARVWDLASRVALAMGAREKAGQFIDRALAIDPDSFSHLAQRAACLMALRDRPAAQAALSELAGADVRRAAEHDTLGNLYSQWGDQARALACFERAVELEPGRSHFQLNLALALQATGDLERAEAAFDRAIDLDSRQTEAWLHRSRLRRQGRDDNHVPALESALARGDTGWRGETTLRYALAKELEDLAEYARSFEQLQRGSRLRRRHMEHDPQADLEAMEQIRTHFSAGRMGEAGAGFDSEEPIFIVGLPRTGTTLVERILGSHSAVFAAGELNNFAECLTAMLAEHKPADRQTFIRLSTGVDMQALGRSYLDSTRPQTGHTPRFIDKLPLNFLYCGPIGLALPRAKIIHLRRHPMDTCYAIYKTLFKQAYPFSYDLGELADYYLAYRTLMQHWQAVMPDRILEVSYEALVQAPEEQSRRLLDFCGLVWEPQCLEFHRSRAPSMTASLAQVRQPVYTSSVGNWRHYREGLAPLEDALGRGGVSLD